VLRNCLRPNYAGSQGRLHGFQIGPTVLMALCKNRAEESVYFSCHFLMDRSSVFFPARSSRPVAARPGGGDRSFR
jgi:hypothetical protein